MLKFIVGFVIGAVSLAYYPVYIDDVKSVTNNAAKAVAEATEEQKLIDKARAFAE